MCPKPGGGAGPVADLRPKRTGRVAILAHMIAHLDLDAFFAAVELHRHPELRGKPVVVGGRPDSRGVVSTASYHARQFGIRSAMSSAEAARLCPQAVFLRPDHTHYREWSRRVWELVASLAPAVERVGIDEGYLVLPGGDPREQAELVQLAVRSRLRLSCSLGVAATKVVAKVASDVRKPGGITVVPPGGEAAFLAPMPARRLPGVGPKAERRLAAAGIATIGALAALEDGALAALLPGHTGLGLRDRARGIDPRLVDPRPAEAVSISSEETFDTDVSDRRLLHQLLRTMAVELETTLARRSLAARTVTTKLRYPDFSIVTRSHTAAATDRGEVIAARACRLLDSALRDRPGPIRLAGVGVSGLVRDLQLELPLDPAVAQPGQSATGRRSSRC